MTALTVKVPANQRLSRKAKLCQIWLIRPDHITDTSNRVDQLLRKTSIDFGAKPMYQHIDDIGLRIETEVPDVLQNHCLRDWTPRMAQQQFEEGKLARLELNFLPCANYFSREKVDFQIGNRKVARLSRMSGASDQSLNSSKQL